MFFFKNNPYIYINQPLGAKPPEGFHSRAEAGHVPVFQMGIHGSQGFSATKGWLFQVLLVRFT